MSSELSSTRDGRLAHGRALGLLRGVPVGVAGAVVLVGVWLICEPRTPDLAAQIYRVNLFDHAGAIVYDTRWYAGHHIPAYSLLFPALAGLLGLRAIAAIAVIISVAIFDRLAQRIYGSPGRWGTLAFALAATGDIWSGRLTFAVGVTFALAAALASANGSLRLAFLLAVLCAATSPVAGLLLALAALTHALASGSPRIALVVAVPVLALLGVIALLFPDGGYEPFPVLSFLATVAVTVAFYCALPAKQRQLRLGAILYLAVCVASLIVHTPMGSNVERYGVLLAMPLLICALAANRGAFTPVRLAILAAMLVWVVWGPVRETAVVAGNPSTEASYYLPVEHFLASHGGDLARVEVPLTRGHWEAAWLARNFSLARGWEKQLDERDDAVLLSGSLNATTYEHWLHQQAVAFVALPDVQLDPSSAQEGALIRGGLPYLRLVFTSAHWRIYRVLDATPLALGPGALSALGHDSFTLQANAPGRFLVRIHYTRYWRVSTGEGCVTKAPGGWTAVLSDRAQTMRITARFSLGRALGASGESCRPERA